MNTPPNSNNSNIVHHQTRTIPTEVTTKLEQLFTTNIQPHINRSPHTCASSCFDVQFFPSPSPRSNGEKKECLTNTSEHVLDDGSTRVDGLTCSEEIGQGILQTGEPSIRSEERRASSWWGHSEDREPVGQSGFHGHGAEGGPA